MVANIFGLSSLAKRRRTAEGTMYSSYVVFLKGKIKTSKPIVSCISFKDLRNLTRSTASFLHLICHH